MKLSIKYLIFSVLIFCIGTTFGQTARKPLSRIVNAPTTTQIAPKLSGDGKYMVFMINANAKNELRLAYSKQIKPEVWSKPETIWEVNKSHAINHIGGYSLSYDGQTLFFTSRKAYGIGKYDIWYCERQGEGWSQPKNMGKPVNSTSDEGCPSLSPDGKYLYFVRCQNMDQIDAEDCQLMVARHKSREYWESPVNIPVNLGSVISPTILPDGETLVFAAKGGQGYDLHQIRKQGNGWSASRPMSFLNTAEDDRFTSMPGPGDVIYYSGKYKGTYDIIKAKVPEDLQPKKVLVLNGEVKVKDQAHPGGSFCTDLRCTYQGVITIQAYYRPRWLLFLLSDSWKKI